MKEREIAPGAVRFKRREIAPGAVRIKGAQRRRCSANAGRARDCGGRLGRLPRAENGCWARDHLVGARERGGGGRTERGGGGRTERGGGGRTERGGGGRTERGGGGPQRRRRACARGAGPCGTARTPSASPGLQLEAVARAVSESVGRGRHVRASMVSSDLFAPSESFRVTPSHPAGAGRRALSRPAKGRTAAARIFGSGSGPSRAVGAPGTAVVVWAAGCRTCLPSLASPSESSMGPAPFRAAAPPARPCCWMPDPSAPPLPSRQGDGQCGPGPWKTRMLDPSAPSPPTKSCGIQYQVELRHLSPKHGPRVPAPGCRARLVARHGPSGPRP